MNPETWTPYVPEDNSGEYTDTWEGFKSSARVGFSESLFHGPMLELVIGELADEEIRQDPERWAAYQRVQTSFNPAIDLEVMGGTGKSVKKESYLRRYSREELIAEKHWPGEAGEDFPDYMLDADGRVSLPRFRAYQAARALKTENEAEVENMRPGLGSLAASVGGNIVGGLAGDPLTLFPAAGAVKNLGNIGRGLAPRLWAAGRAGARSAAIGAATNSAAKLEGERWGSGLGWDDVALSAALDMALAAGFTGLGETVGRLYRKAKDQVPAGPPKAGEPVHMDTQAGPRHEVSSVELDLETRQKSLDPAGQRQHNDDIESSHISRRDLDDGVNAPDADDWQMYADEEWRKRQGHTADHLNPEGREAPESLRLSEELKAADHAETRPGALVDENGNQIATGDGPARTEGWEAPPRSALLDEGRSITEPGPRPALESGSFSKLFDEAVQKSPHSGKIGEVVELDIKNLNFSQTEVNYWRKKRVSQKETQELPADRITEANGHHYYWRNFDERRKSLFEHGWPENDILDAVIMPPSGQLTLMDNTRITALHALGAVDISGRPITPKIKIRDPRQKLTKAERWRLRAPKTGEIPETWGEATRLRIKTQYGPVAPTGQEFGIENVPAVARHDLLEKAKKVNRKK